MPQGAFQGRVSAPRQPQHRGLSHWHRGERLHNMGKTQQSACFSSLNDCIMSSVHTISCAHAVSVHCLSSLLWYEQSGSIQCLVKLITPNQEHIWACILGGGIRLISDTRSTVSVLCPSDSTKPKYLTQGLHPLQLEEGDTMCSNNISEPSSQVLWSVLHSSRLPT